MSDQDGTNLLEALKQLYFRIMALHAESRARTSMKQSNVSITQDISSPLFQVIDKLATNTTYVSSDSSGSPDPGAVKVTHEHVTISREPDSWKELGELSLHLKDSHRYTGQALDMGQRLMQSTWEHLHTSIRLARQGDSNAARVHAELSSNALNEAIHYLSEAVYSEFSEEVMKALENINKQL